MATNCLKLFASKSSGLSDVVQEFCCLSQQSTLIGYRLSAIGYCLASVSLAHALETPKPDDRVDSSIKNLTRSFGSVVNSSPLASFRDFFSHSQRFFQAVAASTLAFLNFKGGVGKTTNVVNISTLLARDPQIGGKRVLVVDMDPQCNSSFLLLTRQRWMEVRDQGKTVDRVFGDPKERRNPEANLNRLVTSAFSDHATQGRLDVVACSMNAIRWTMDPGLLSRSTHFRFLFLALDSVREAYDFIILDCGPSFNVMTRNALRAADYVLMPYTPDFLALEGIKLLGTLSHEFAAEVQLHSPGSKTARPLGIIVNRYRANTSASRSSVQELHDVVEQMRASKLLPPFTTVFEPYLQEATIVNDAANGQTTLLDCDPDSPITDSYRKLTTSIIEIMHGLNHD
jgi:chromosome partitioning protein